MHQLLRAAGLLVITSSPLLGCDESSVDMGTPDTGMDSPTSDGGPDGSGDPDGGAPGSDGAVATDAGGDASTAYPPNRALRFVSYAAAPAQVRVCFRHASDSDFQPMYASAVQRFEVGGWVAATNGQHLYRVFDAATWTDCQGTPVYESDTTLTNDSIVQRRTIVYSPPTGGTASVVVSRIAPGELPAEDFVHFMVPTFIPEFTENGGATTTFDDVGRFEKLPAGKTGVLSGASGVADRPFLTQAGGAVSVFLVGAPGSVGAPDRYLVCDDFAPAIGQLSDCRSTVRAP